MHENPYQPPDPTTLNTGNPTDQLTPDSVRNIAIYQKYLLLFILVYLVAMFGSSWVARNAQIYFAVFAAGIFVIGIFLAVLLAIRVYGTVFGLIMGLLSSIPFFGLFFLLMINSKAIKILNQHGIKVGLMGANLSQIEKLDDQT